jgi:demethylmenaquinone methyltransferase/2-methoxy-6-polyprenyl-1,4-benzoquinol methylase
MDKARIKQKYRRNVRFYDLLSARPTDALRREAARRLALRRGDSCLDLGCGTGLSLPLLREAVGDSGKVYGVELSPDMLAVARAKVQSAGWRNVELIEADAETFEIDSPLDEILCFYTHDIMLSPTALPRALKHLKVGGRMVAAGGKLTRGWKGWLVNAITIAYSLPAVTTLDRARSYEPFAPMAQLLTDFHVEERKLGSQYLAWGTFAGTA